MTNHFVFLALACVLASAAANTVTPQDMENEAEAIYNKTADGLNVAAMVVGSILALFGYKYKRTTFFTIGFVGCGALTFLGVSSLAAGTDYQAWAPLTSLFAAGLVGGVLCAVLLEVGVFAVGCGLGVVGAVLLQTALLHRITNDQKGQQAILFATMAIFGLILGTITLKMRRPLLIVATSFIGTFLATYGVGHFAGSLPSPFDLAGAIDSAAKEGAGAVPVAWWIYLAAIVVLGTASTIFQFKVTGKDDKPAQVETNYLVLEAGNQYGSTTNTTTATEKPGPGKAVRTAGHTLAYN